MEKEQDFEIHFAPVQGQTDAVYRNLHAGMFRGVKAYYTPFIRLEQGNTFRPKDLRDCAPEHNAVPWLVPQVLGGEPEELRLALGMLQGMGYREADISSLESLTAGISDSEVILALSAGQPASSDWTPFTPYSYRTEYSWPVSDYLARTFSDSYAATHYSVETDSGVTLVTDVLHERMDRLYTRGLIEAGTSVLSLPVLSDAEPQRFAVTAVYIHP